MFDAVVRRFIIWARHRALTKVSLRRNPVVTFDDKFLFSRYEFLWCDEYPDVFYDRMKEYAKADGEIEPQRPHRPPWWRPFNVLLHCWSPVPGTREGFHDHPRWSITVCLRGKIIEHTPWWSRTLVPGSIVIRSYKAIHAFEVPKGYSGKTWTLFIVGRRNHRQNTFVITTR